VDFKADLPLLTDAQKVEFAKDLSAIANTLGGMGYLIIGVDDRGRVKGVRSLDISEARLQQIAARRCDPPVNFKVDTRDLRSGRVVVIQIPRSIVGPHQVKDTGAFYVRRGTTTTTASTSEIARMILRRIEIERGKRNEYDRYGPSTRVEIMQRDVFRAIRQMGFKRGLIKMECGERQYEPREERQVAFADGFIGRVPTRLHFLFFIGNIDRHRLRRTYTTIEEGWLNLLKRNRVNLGKAHLFLVITDGIASKGPIEEWSLRGPCTVSTFEPSLVYAGLGKRTRVKDIDFKHPHFDLTRILPRFFIQKAKSIDSIELKLTCIRDWLTENIDILRSVVKFQRAISCARPSRPFIY